MLRTWDEHPVAHRPVWSVAQDRLVAACGLGAGDVEQTDRARWFAVACQRANCFRGAAQPLHLALHPDYSAG